MESAKNSDKFASLIKGKTAKDVLGSDFQLIEIDANENVLTALNMLQKYNISSLPVFDSEAKKYVGSVSLLDIAIVIYALAVAKSFVDLFSEKVIEWHDFDNEDFKVFSNEKVGEFCNTSGRNVWACVRDNTPLSAIIKLLANPAQDNQDSSMDNVRRLGVHNAEGKLVGIITQFNLVQYLRKQIHESKIFDNIKFNDVLPVSCSSKDVYTIKETDEAIEAFKLMLEKSISGVGVLNDKDQLVAMFSASDVKREKLNQELFSDLRGSAKEYLSKSKRFFEKEVNQEELVLRKEDTLMEVLRKMEKFHLHQIFEVDDNKKPVRVVSLCDIIGIFFESCD